MFGLLVCSAINLSSKQACFPNASIIILADRDKIVRGDPIVMSGQPPYVTTANGIGYLMAYEGGEIHPGDDMAGSRVRWWGLDKMKAEGVKVLVPPEGRWFDRAVELYRLWSGREIELQPDLLSLAARKPK